MASTTGKVSSVFRTGLFNGKVAIVTGGSTGIGRAITQELLFLGLEPHLLLTIESKWKLIRLIIFDQVDLAVKTNSYRIFML